MIPRFIPVSEIQEGDVIAWQSRTEHTLIYSRVVFVEEDEAYEEAKIICKGKPYDENGPVNFVRWSFNLGRKVLLIERNTNGSP